MLLLHASIVPILGAGLGVSRGPWRRVHLKSVVEKSVTRKVRTECGLPDHNAL